MNCVVVNSFPLASIADPSMKVWDHSIFPSIPCSWSQT
jgi:hypothetical protein